MTINNSSNIKNKNINKTLDILEGNLNENISEVSKENRNVFSFDKVKTNEDKELLCKLYRLFGNEKYLISIFIVYLLYHFELINILNIDLLTLNYWPKENLLKKVKDFINIIISINPLNTISPNISLIPSSEKIKIVIVSNEQINSILNTEHSVLPLLPLIFRKKKGKFKENTQLDIEVDKISENIEYIPYPKTSNRDEKVAKASDNFNMLE